MISATYYSFVCFLPSTRRAKWHINNINTLCCINFDVAMDVVLVYSISEIVLIFSTFLSLAAFSVDIALLSYTTSQDRWCLCWVFCIIRTESLYCDRIIYFLCIPFRGVYVLLYSDAYFYRKLRFELGSFF